MTIVLRPVGPGIWSAVVAVAAGTLLQPAPAGRALRQRKRRNPKRDAQAAQAKARKITRRHAK